MSKIDLTALTPPADTLLAHAAVAQMILQSELSAVAAHARDADDADRLSLAQAEVAQRYQIIRALLADYTDNPASLMSPALEYARAQMARMQPERWAERVMTCYVVGGILRDFYRTLLPAMPSALAVPLEQALASERDGQLCAGVLEAEIHRDPSQLSRLSLWARRVVGDTVLIARAALAPDPSDSQSEERYEPLFSDIYTEHTRRLEHLGVTA